MAEVDMALIWLNPAATPYTSDQNENNNQLLKANLELWRLQVDVSKSSEQQGPYRQKDQK